MRPMLAAPTPSWCCCSVRTSRSSQRERFGRSSHRRIATCKHDASVLGRRGGDRRLPVGARTRDEVSPRPIPQPVVAAGVSAGLSRGTSLGGIGSPGRDVDSRGLRHHHPRRTGVRRQCDDPGLLRGARVENDRGQLRHHVAVLVAPEPVQHPGAHDLGLGPDFGVEVDVLTRARA